MTTTAPAQQLTTIHFTEDGIRTKDLIAVADAFQVLTDQAEAMIRDTNSNQTRFEREVLGRVCFLGFDHTEGKVILQVI